MRNFDDSEFFLSLIVPIYNESEVVDIFFDRLLPIISESTRKFEIICVNDGSTDNSLALLEKWHQTDARIVIVDLVRNFGKEIALTVGLDFAQGDAVIPIDADLQDPPEIIPEMIGKWLQGFDSVLAVRTDRHSDSFVKRTTAAAFYHVIGKMSDIHIVPNAGDFRLLDKTVVKALRKLPERNRFMKGLYAWVGHESATVEHKRDSRADGKTKLRYWKLWNLALEGIFSFTTAPLRIWTYIGFIIATLSGMYGGLVILRTLVYGVEVPGYASLMVVVLFLSGINMIGLGILGEYVGRIFIEVKQRPLYMVGKTVGIQRPAYCRRGTMSDED